MTPNAVARSRYRDVLCAKRARPRRPFVEDIHLVAAGLREAEARIKPVGVALAKPGRRVVSLMGDGSSLYSVQAIWSAAQLGVRIVFVILKNGRYAALQDFAPVFGFSRQEHVQGTDLPGLDFVSIAKGLGCAGVSVCTPEGLTDALAGALSSDQPVLIEVEVEDRASHSA